MSMAKWSMDLEWKEHNVDLSAFDAWCKENAGAQYCGNSADSKLHLWFLEEPSEEEKAACADKWETLDDAEDEMCASYKSAEELAVAAAAKKASAKAKLAALGLDADELKAILG